MTEKSLIEQIQADELKGASPEDKFNAKLSTLSDQEFARVSSYLCRLGDQEKQREANAPAPPRELSEHEAALAKLDDAQYADHLRELGINQNLAFDGSLSEAMQRETKRRARE